MLSQKHTQDLFIYAKKTYNYDPDVWGDTLEEAIGRVRDGYHVPFHLVKKLVQHATLMQGAMISMDAAIEARMTDLDDREELLPGRKARPRRNFSLAVQRGGTPLIVPYLEDRGVLEKKDIDKPL